MFFSILSGPEFHSEKRCRLADSEIMDASTQFSKSSMKIYDCFHDRDRISELHEDILSDILSRLPIKDVLRTSVLSKDWKYKWISTSNVDLENMTSKGFLTAGKFANFVDKILASCKLLKSFRLCCGIYYDKGRAQTWISTALMHKLESFEVQCGVKVVYPCSLLNSTSLRKLSLKSDCSLNVAAINVGSNLISLYLYNVTIMNENPNTSTVKFTFLVLKSLTTTRCKWLNVKSVEIHAPSLTEFASNPSSCCPKDYDYSFVIIAPRLARFESSYGYPEEISLNGSSVVSASLLCHDEVDDFQLLTKIGVRIAKLLNEFTNLEQLEAYSFMAEVSRLGPPLLWHYKLRRLELADDWCPALLYHILHAAPSLKFLKMRCVFDYDGEIEPVPSCIIYQLEVVEFWGTHWEAEQCKFAKFLLKNAEKLKKMTLFGKWEFPLDKLILIDKLLGYPRHDPWLLIE